MVTADYCPAAVTKFESNEKVCLSNTDCSSCLIVVLLTMNSQLKVYSSYDSGSVASSTKMETISSPA
jgi:ferredoxin-like protein FixX